LSPISSPVLILIPNPLSYNKIPLFRDRTKHVVCNRHKKFTARKRVDLFSPQMDVSDAKPSLQYTEAGSETINVIDTTVVCEDKTATCFVESGNLNKSKWQLPKQLPLQEVRLMEIADFMGRPYLLEPPFTWTTSNAFGATINNGGTGYSPSTILKANTDWLHKIEGFNLFRATFVLRVELNAYAFQAGRLLIHYLPNYTNFTGSDPGYSKKYNYSMVTKVQHPHVELDCRQTFAELRVPWIAPSPYWDKKNTIYDWGTIFIDVLSVIAYGPSGLVKPPELTCYGYWENIELAAPMVPQMTVKSELQAKPISSILRTTSKVLSKFDDIPEVSSITQPVAWVTNALSGIASYFGWSKPLLNVEHQLIVKQKLRYAGTSDGASTAIPLGMIADNKLEVYDRASINSADEMSFNFLKKVPLLILNPSNSYKPYQWSTGDTTGSVEFGSMIGVSNLGHQNVFSYNTAAHTYTCNYYAPYQYLASKFMYWRGSFNLTLKFVKTIYHTGRLQVTWTPYHNVGTIPDTTTGFFSLRTIIDIREQDEITLNLPYMVNEPWLYTQSAHDLSTNVGSSSGYLSIVVLNELRCPETCALTCDILMFLEPGEDFELAVPCPDSVHYPGYFAPQMNTSSNLVHKGIGDAKVCPATLDIDKFTVGERFTGVKQLINRFQPLVPVTTASPWNTHREVAIYPHFFGTAGIVSTATGVLTNANYLSDALSFTAGLYAYFRGGMELAWSGSTATIYGTVVPDLIPAAGVIALPYAFDLTNQGTPNNASTYAVSNNFSAFNSTVPGDADDGSPYFHIPYYCKYPFSLVLPFDGTIATNWVEPSQPNANISFTNTGTFSTTAMVSRNAADDFQFMFFIGCPPLLSSKT
jgi:hypothetical protein